MKKRILLVGAQGSGKSTQAKLLAEFLNVPVISTGEIFRKLATEDSEEGRRIRGILQKGRLVDDETTSKIVEARLKETDCQAGFVIDGYPRNIEQVNFFDPNFDTVFYLKVPESVVLERLMQRGREDDTPDLIKTRLALYYQQTEGLLKYYQNKEILVEIDGAGIVETIQSSIRDYL